MLAEDLTRRLSPEVLSRRPAVPVRSGYPPVGVYIASSRFSSSVPQPSSFVTYLPSSILSPVQKPYTVLGGSERFGVHASALHLSQLGLGCRSRMSTRATAGAVVPVLLPRPEPGPVCKLPAPLLARPLRPLPSPPKTSLR